MSATKRLILLAGVVCALVAPISAVPVPVVTIKLPTIAPNGSPWHKALLDMGAAMDRETAGRVKVQVFANGALGSEPAVVRNMRSGQFQASLLMLPGLSLIDDSFNALGIPFFFQNDAETKAVTEALTPLIEQRISGQGFHLLAWTSGGWIQIFSKKPIKSLAELKQAKLWTSDGDVKMVQWYKTNGFHPVALDANSVGPQLKLGMIDATPSPAYVAQLLNLYVDAPYMLDVHVAPFLAAIVVTNTTWNSISPEDQVKVTAAAKAFEKVTSIDIPAKDASSVAEMQKRSLTVTVMDKKSADEFQAEVGRLVASMKGDMVPADLYDKAKAARDAFRAKGKTPGPR
jgi:TRAP-type C4-dicarboxylate transport system substrate-binding protein